MSRFRQREGRCPWLLVRQGLLLLLACAGLGSCVPPDSRGEATNRLVAQGLIAPGARPGEFLFGPGLLMQTQVVNSSRNCEGAAGSLLPPLAIRQCVFGPGLVGIQRFEDFMNGLAGQQSLYQHSVRLPGIERSWIRQNTATDCWAAAIQMTRDYLRLRHVDQRTLLSATRSLCPLSSMQQSGAELYEIGYSIARILGPVDGPAAKPHFCNTEGCIIQSLVEGRPVIMLANSHAVVISGADFALRRGNQGPIYILEQAYVLDPAAQRGESTPVSMATICGADAFIAY